MKIRIAFLVILALSVALVAPSVAAENRGDRVALVIGNAKYPDSEKPLKEPINDARDLADELKRDGFDVDLGENLTIDGMRRAFDRLYGSIKPGSVALVFFSGFGIQSNRQSYMIPIDAQIWTEPDVRRDGFSLETVLSEINSRGASVKIALVDASRRNPFERRFRSFSAGLAPIIAPGGTLVMYSAALSSVVSDNGSDHSLFVSELLKEIRVPSLTAEETLNRTRVGVTRASRSEQVPWISSSLADEFSFVPGVRVSSGKGTVVERTPPSDTIDDRPPQKTAIVAPEVPKVVPKKVEEPKVAIKEEPKETPKIKEADIVAPTTDSRAEERLELALADDPTIRSLSVKIADNPADGNALYRRGQVYASKGAFRLAIRDFNEAIRLNPKDVEAFNNRCFARTVANDLPAALKDCNEALRLRPNFVDALDSRGLLNLKSGQTKNAIADFDAALKINPRLTSSLYGRGLAKQRSGLISEGEIDISNAKSMDPNIAKEFAGYGVD
ncbi:MAG: caspase family protein [Rhodopseudomonas sp.]|uniref:caspase family protein n=1 Tax=Rhodopseudomonas sp. TaxID=1078 RepID=UPI0017A3D344|nr:caspase family protein [Rhodopseudomonas sp.]NVN88326.1 caspase family protein [Rhodopseudomonas sp.]